MESEACESLTFLAYARISNNIQEKLDFRRLWIIFINFAILVSGRDYGNKEKVRTERN